MIRRASPAVSVVVPTFERPRQLVEALASVVAQTFEAWEAIVVDDAGRGTAAQRATAAALEASFGDPRVRYLARARRGGGAAARNTGIAAANAPLIAFLDDDDRWYPNKLERQRRVFDGADDVVLVYGGYRQIGPGDREKVVVPAPDAGEVRRLLERNGIGGTSLVMVRRSALRAVGGFDEALRARQDVDLYVRLAAQGQLVGITDRLIDKVDHDAPTIGKDRTAVLAGFGRFYAKHRAAFDREPAAHAAFLRIYAGKLLAAQKLCTARPVLWRAWRLAPLRPAAGLLAMTARRPLWGAYRALTASFGGTVS